MALINNLTEIKEVLPKLVSNLSNIALQPVFAKTEYKYIVPIIGPALYATLCDHYANNTLDADEAILVKKLQLVIAAYAYKDDLGLYVLTLTDSGAKKIAHGASEPIRAWEMERTETALLTTALDGAEVLLSYLFDNKALFPEWTASEQYKRIASLLIRTGIEYSDYYTLFQPQRTFFILKNVIRDAQEQYIEEAIGKDLLVYLRDKDAPTDDEKECLRLLKKSLALFGILKGCDQFSVSFTENGFTILGDKTIADSPGQQSIDIKLLAMKMSACETDGNSFLAKSRGSLVALYGKAGATDDFKAAYAKGPLTAYVAPADYKSGNEDRKIFALR